jgi:3,4-dihydroxy 2-butanone 4-phosphate synthase/GTP cyclohydrolase II
VLCEIMNADGTMARLPDLERFAAEHGLKIGAISDLIQYRSRTERLIERIAERPLATVHGAFRLVRLSRQALRRDAPGARARPVSPDTETLVRVHEPLSVMDLLDTGHTSHSWSIAAALAAIAQGGARRRRLAAPSRERAGAAAPRARRRRTGGLEGRLRNYGIGAQILRDLNVGKMRLLAKPRKMPSMAGFDLEVTGYVEQPAARAS